ncbi:ribonuclease domain-containing protein [Rummeliibacillus sp. SL167]|uniref:ribonuclease domain-containing protein n=1 Tax=Rummeliibacillus sp. SL167 TaxID=2579792 RepID=UPI0021027201|nr:ribonuclease domain-containing protein [Rummeliibacillus sp. SL167]
MISYALGNIVLSAVGTQRIRSCNEDRNDHSQTTTKVVVHKVKGAAQKIPTLNLYPYAPQHQLAGVNAGIVPYNTVNSVGLRDQLISMAKVKSKGKGKSGADNIALHAKYKEGLKVTESANPIVDSLRQTGKLPSNYVNKDVAVLNGWKPGKALNNYVSGGQLGGDVFKNTTNVLPNAPGRVWYEADVGLNNTMARSKQPGSRLLYSNDGQMYITTDHYKTVHFIGTYK